MIGSIVSNNRITGSLFEMRIHAPEARAAAGQFIMLKCGDGTTLRRPISVALYNEGILRICYDVRGKGTAWLSERAAGESVDFLEPIGHGFTKRDGVKALLVGGGIGIYPLLALGSMYKSDAVALFGFRNAALVNYTGEFEAFGVSVSVITDDGSSGRKGFVTDLLRDELDTGAYGVIHTCGPKVMMAGVAKLAREYGVACEVSMEERMACGVGACHGCVCRTLIKSNEGISGEEYKRVCVDGPVFDAEEIKW